MAEAAAPGDAAALAPPSTLPLRVLTCQTDGTLEAAVSANIARWSSLLEADELTTAEIDVVHFPETAFSRYVYSSTEDLTEYVYGGAEEAGAGRCSHSYALSPSSSIAT